MATKKDLQNAIEGLAEQMAVHHGGTITTKTIKVGGRATESRVAEGGMFDLDTCRGLLIHALKTHAEALVTHMPTRPSGGTAGNGTGPRLGPDGKVHLPADANGVAS